MNNIKVSVVIPVYNVEKYLRECLDSIRNQTLKEIEIICINDESTDSSRDILEEYQELDRRFIIIDQKNQGQGAARNAGIKISQGEYIYIIDSDDYLDIDALEELYGEAKNKELDIVFFGGKTIYETEELKEKFPLREHELAREGIPTDIMSGKEMMVAMEKDFSVYVSLEFINHKYLKENNILFPEEIEHEDNLFMYRLLIPAKRTKMFHKKYMNYRVRGNSVMTRRFTDRDLKGYAVVYREIITNALTLELNESESRSIQKMLDKLIANMSRIYTSLDEDEKKKIHIYKDAIEGYFFEHSVFPLIQLRSELEVKAETYFSHCFDDLAEKEVCIWGTGKFASLFYERYNGSCNVTMIVDSSAVEKEFTWNGYVVSSPDMLMDNKGYKVIICIKDYLGVLLQLKEFGIEDIGIYSPYYEYK